LALRDEPPRHYDTREVLTGLHEGSGRSFQSLQTSPPLVVCFFRRTILLGSAFP